VDALACQIILKRAKFAPARWSDGSPVPGVYRWTVSFIQEGDTLDRFSDIEINVTNLPHGKRSPVYVKVAYASDADGRIRDCVDAPGIDHASKPSDPALVRIACQAVEAQWKPFTVLDADGKPTRSVQTATVKFTPDKKR
jgi:hypothetical protein